MQVYPIFDKANEVGTAEIRENGLYLLISCRCKDLKRITKIRLITPKKEHMLGTCVLSEGSFVLKKQIPKKNISPGPYRFQVLFEEKQRFIPISENEPLAYIQYLRESKFCCQDGIPGIIIELKDQPDSDQNPLYQHKSGRL